MLAFQSYRLMKNLCILGCYKEKGPTGGLWSMVSIYQVWSIIPWLARLVQVSYTFIVWKPPSRTKLRSGSPSGHAMLSSAVGFVFVSYMCAWIQKQEFTRCKRLCQNLLWFSYVLLLIVVCFVRMHIATHFPHQVIFGTCLGEWFAQSILKKSKWASWCA